MTEVKSLKFNFETKIGISKQNIFHTITKYINDYSVKKIGETFEKHIFQKFNVILLFNVTC